MKPRKSIARSKKPIRRTSTIGTIRARMAFKPTKKAQAIHDAMKKALDWYFLSHGEMGAYCQSAAPCQICGRTLMRGQADPAHLSRRWKGLHEICHVLAAHRICHTWLDNGSHQDRIQRARESKASCQTGGVIPWTIDQAASLHRWLSEGIDPINLGKKSCP